jgi:hypothetical protein
MSLSHEVADLWRLGVDDVHRLYNLFLAHLMIHDRHERIVFASRQIRRYASRGPGPLEGVFTFYTEIDALCHLGDYAMAWRQLRRMEEVVYGKRLDLNRHRWTAEEASHRIAFYYAPLLYFRKQFRQGCSLLEKALALGIRRGKQSTFQLLWYIDNGMNQPVDRCCVTLSHFYARLDKDLRTWRHWKAFVKGIHPRLLRLAGIQREELLADSAVLSDFLVKLKAAQAARGLSFSGNQSDFIDSPAKVKKRDLESKKKRADFKVRIRPVQEASNQQLKALFPELKALL